MVVELECENAKMAKCVDSLTSGKSGEAVTSSAPPPPPINPAWTPLHSPRTQRSFQTWPSSLSVNGTCDVIAPSGSGLGY